MSAILPRICWLQNFYENLKLQSKCIADGRLGFVGQDSFGGSLRQRVVAAVDVGSELSHFAQQVLEWRLKTIKIILIEAKTL